VYHVLILLLKKVERQVIKEKMGLWFNNDRIDAIKWHGIRITV